MLVVLGKALDERMFGEVPALFERFGNRLLVRVSGGYEQHRAEGIPVGLVRVVGLVVALLPGLGKLVFRRHRLKHLVAPCTDDLLHLLRGELLLVLGLRALEVDAVGFGPSFHDRLPVAGVIAGEGARVQVGLLNLISPDNHYI